MNMGLKRLLNCDHWPLFQRRNGIPDEHGIETLTSVCIDPPAASGRNGIPDEHGIETRELGEGSYLRVRRNGIPDEHGIETIHRPDDLQDLCEAQRHP